MNNTIILSQLSETIAGLTQSEAADAENFVRELVALVAERLEADGRVEVPALGTFVIADDGVDYAPDAALAEAINAPFAAFEAIELPDEVELTESIDSPESAHAPDDSEPSEEAEQSAESEELEEPENPATSEPEEQAIAEAAEFEQEALAEEPSEDSENPEPAAEPVTEPVSEPAPESFAERRRPLTWPWWLIACVVCFIGGYMAGSSTAGDSGEPLPVQPSEPLDSVDVIDEPEVYYLPEEELNDDVELSAEPRRPITDTVSSNRFLTTIARRHYGHMDFWPYIYEANADKLGDPNKVAAGTVVIVPSPDSLHLDPDCIEQLTVARAKGDEIYKRFNSK
ncbi:MAG: hypothetical protein HDR46_00525 [Bacteroides sp.]|nr:hypothetical protein [Bacteroides sp.]